MRENKRATLGFLPPQSELIEAMSPGSGALSKKEDSFSFSKNTIERITLGKNTLNIFGGQIEIGVSQRTLSRF